MGGRKALQTKQVDERPPFFDEEERELIESFEAALDRGEVQMNTPEELERLKAEWKAIAEASQGQEMVYISLDAVDFAKIKAIAGERGVSYNTLIGSVLHEFALNADS